MISRSVFETPTLSCIPYGLWGTSARLSGRCVKSSLCKTEHIIYPNRLVPFPVFPVLVRGSTLTKVYQAWKLSHTRLLPLNYPHLPSSESSDSILDKFLSAFLLLHSVRTQRWTSIQYYWGRRIFKHYAKGRIHKGKTF